MPFSVSRYEPSARAPPSVVAPTPQRFCWPRAQKRQRPHPGMNCSTTWSPISKPSVFGPMPSTTPAPSWPAQVGVMDIGRSPVTKWSSEWQRPLATTLTSSSFWRGPLRSRSATSHFSPTPRSSAPRTFIVCLPSIQRLVAQLTDRTKSVQGAPRANYWHARGCHANEVWGRVPSLQLFTGGTVSLNRVRVRATSCVRRSVSALLFSRRVR